MKIAAAAGVVPYLKQSKLKQFFEELYDRFRLAGYRWSSHDQHRKLLDKLDDVGALKSIPAEVRAQFVRWVVLCFIGEPGGYGMGINRAVFYSKSRLLASRKSSSTRAY